MGSTVRLQQSGRTDTTFHKWDPLLLIRDKVHANQAAFCERGDHALLDAAGIKRRMTVSSGRRDILFLQDPQVFLVPIFYRPGAPLYAGVLSNGSTSHRSLQILFISPDNSPTSIKSFWLIGHALLNAHRSRVRRTHQHPRYRTAPPIS